MGMEGRREGVFWKLEIHSSNSSMNFPTFLKIKILIRISLYPRSFLFDRFEKMRGFWGGFFEG